MIIEDLRSASAYPHPVSGIEILETHISWVLLTGEIAYKIKKPVDLGFLDFRALEKRRYYCEEELRLNRNWASRLYLDVVPITKDDDSVMLGGEGTPIEYAVRMRQFDQALRLDHLIETGRLTAHDVLELAEEIARRHSAARRIEPYPELLPNTLKLVWDNFDELQDEVAIPFLEKLRTWMQRRIDRYETLMWDRIEAGFFRECHGDLHLANIVRLPEGIRAFDCIEFSKELREIDVVADYAFLTMDFIARGAAGFAYTFVNRYLEKTGDYEGAQLLPVYLLYRAMVRAKVAVIDREQHEARTDRAEDRHTINRYVALARALISDRRPVLVMMTGLSGSGKTWLSTQLVAALPALRLRSDLERKRLFALEETADTRSDIAAGIYDTRANVDVYQRLMTNAEQLLRAGINVILDATFLEAEKRFLVRQVAEACAVKCVTVNTLASPGTLAQRLESRASSGDASEADQQVLRYQIANRDPLEAEELERTLAVDTEDEVDIAMIVAGIRELKY